VVLHSNIEILQNDFRWIFGICKPLIFKALFGAFQFGILLEAA
jgi:hypothetical protein